jgi:hypothetical protein
MPARWSIEVQRRLIMHPLIHEQMAKQRMDGLQREAAAMQHLNRAKNSDLDNKTGNHSSTHLLWYLLVGLHIPTSSQNPGTYPTAAQLGEMKREGGIREEYTLDRLQARLNATIRVIGLAALGLGLLIGGFLNSRFGLLPIVLLSGVVLVVVSFPILMRSVWMLRKYIRMPLQR